MCVFFMKRYLEFRAGERSQADGPGEQTPFDGITSTPCDGSFNDVN